MKSKNLSIRLPKGKTAYNPTVPFEYKGKKYIGVRVESLTSELDSQTFFAYEKNKNTNLWEIDDSLGSLPLQDPSYVKINGEIIILGVKVWQDEKEINWRQDIYKGNSLKDLKYFASGPIGMKDIRLVDLEDKVGVFTRPQGRIGGKGKIGYLEIKNIDELPNLTKKDWYYDPKIIDCLFDENHWGGVNQAIRLSGGNIGVLGHIAHQTINKRNELTKHYYGMAFQFNPKTKKHSGFKVIAKREDFPSSPSKRSTELDDIIFLAGIDENNNLFAGVSDYTIGIMKINNPFL